MKMGVNWRAESRVLGIELVDGMLMRIGKSSHPDGLYRHVAHGNLSISLSKTRRLRKRLQSEETTTTGQNETEARLLLDKTPDNG